MINIYPGAKADAPGGARPISFEMPHTGKKPGIPAAKHETR